MENPSVNWFILRPTIGYSDFGIPPMCTAMDLRKPGFTIADVQVWFNAVEEIIYRKQMQAEREAHQ
ncbi:hypothetical protein [Vibrio phage vB_VpM-pA2SJ1]|uniref:Uncharacterized protein n=1 Tax=Vibrio phage vB_VpM-pA2SJ1 TaxID=3095964 RepID=A0AAX4J5S3_9CAUD